MYHTVHLLSLELLEFILLILCTLFHYKLSMKCTQIRNNRYNYSAIDFEMERSKKVEKNRKRARELKPVVVIPNQPCDVCPRLVVRVRVSESSLYRGNQIAQHKFRLCTVVCVKVTTAKLAKSKKRRSSLLLCTY